MALLFALILAVVTYDDASLRLDAIDTRRELEDAQGFVNACIGKIGVQNVGGSVWVNGKLMRCRVFPQEQT